MAAQQYTPAALASLLQKLSIEEEDNDEVLKYANNILKKAKTDSFALRTKVTALIKLERYEDALKLLEDEGDSAKLQGEMELEHAYCLYKAGRLEDARAVASKGSEDDKRKRGLQHLEAQSAYRLEKFHDATGIYNDLVTSSGYAESEEYDLKVNMLASKAQTVFKGQGDLVSQVKTNRDDLDAYETAFNAACLSIARGDFRGSLVLLKRAKDVCSAIEGLSAEELAGELAPLLAQEIFVLLKLGKNAEAAAICKSLDIRTLTDASLKPIATNNVVLSAASGNPHLASRLIATAASVNKPSAKPFTFQSQILHRNATTLALKSGKLHEANELAKKHLNLFPGDYSMSTIAAAASIGAEEELSLKPKAKSRKLEALYKADPTDVGLCLTLVQAYMKENDLTGAANILDVLLKALEDHPDKRYLPGVVGVVVALYSLQGRKQAIKAELESATDYWSKDSRSNPEILLASGIAKLSSTANEDLEQAASTFETLISTHPSPMANAGYVASHPTDSIPDHIGQLTSIDSLIKGINIDDLINAGISSTTSSKRAATEKPSKPRAMPLKKKRKVKLPKNYDPEKKPDPERWLPLRDRSTYKPKGKKDKKKMRDLTQGGPVASSDGDVEMIGGNSVKKVTQGSGGGGKGGKKKGKGKGKK